VVIEFLVGFLIVLAFCAGALGVAATMIAIWNMATKNNPKRKQASLGNAIVGLVSFSFLGAYAVVVCVQLGKSILN